MKTKILLLTTAILMALNLQAQAPAKFNYQGIARASNGDPLANQNLGIQISILNPSNTALYVERHTATTNDFGLYTLQIGDGTPVTGTMSGVNWAGGTKKIKVEIDPNGGTSYTDLGTTELLSVPYALYAAEAPSSGGPPTGAAGGDLTGNYPNPAIAGNAVTSAKIDNGAVATADLANNSVTSGKIDNGTVATADLSNNAITSGKIANNAVTAPKIDDMGATNGEVLKWNGTDWAPATDIQGTTGTTYTAGAGIAISGSNVISADLGSAVQTGEIDNNAITSGKIENGAVATADLANNSITDDKIVNGEVSTADLANNSVTGAKINDMGASSGQVLEYDGSDWAPATPSTGSVGWELDGNAVTATDFIGTTNYQALQFKVDNAKAGIITPGAPFNNAFGGHVLESITTGDYNSAFGAYALSDNTTGSSNSAFGSSALLRNTTGDYNSAFGLSALRKNTSGADNSAFGYGALYNNTNGLGNTSFGFRALYGNTSGGYNVAVGLFALLNTTNQSELTAIGSYALVSNTSGNENTAVGFEALKANTSGQNNTATGHQALTANSTGDLNSAFGKNALFSNTTGDNNSAFGNAALNGNTTGFDNSAFGNAALLANTTGNSNVAIGATALDANTIGGLNVAVGVNAMGANIDGEENTAMGTSAMSLNISGDRNSAFGRHALQHNDTGNGNTAIGYAAMKDFSGFTFNNVALGSYAEVSDGVDYASAIGSSSLVTVSNRIIVGATFISGIGGYANWTNYSDIRFKKDVKPQKHGLDFIMELQPITYHVNAQKLFDFHNSIRENKIEMTPVLQKSIREKASTLESGFSAQQVEAAAKVVGYDFSGVNPPANENDHYTLEYASFVVPLVKAVQEQQQMIEEGKKEREQQQKLIQKQQQTIQAQQVTIKKILARLDKMEQQ